MEELKQRFPELKQLAEQREGLRAIFEDRTITTAAYEAGCDDALVGQQGGKMFIDFSRAAPSRDAAITSAKADVQRVFAALLHLDE